MWKDLKRKFYVVWRKYKIVKIGENINKQIDLLIGSKDVKAAYILVEANNALLESLDELKF